MWHTYDNGHFWGMHYLWWIFLIIIFIWIFITPYGIPGQRTKRETPLDILKRRFARREITKEEFEDMKKQIEKN